MRYSASRFSLFGRAADVTYRMIGKQEPAAALRSAVKFTEFVRFIGFSCSKNVVLRTCQRLPVQLGSLRRMKYLTRRAGIFVIPAQIKWGYSRSFEAPRIRLQILSKFATNFLQFSAASIPATQERSFRILFASLL